MRAARKALRGAAERHGEGVPRWRGRSYLSVFVKTEKHTLALSTGSTAALAQRFSDWCVQRDGLTWEWMGASCYLRLGAALPRRFGIASASGVNPAPQEILTSVAMKSFERLVLTHLKDITGPLLDPLQFSNQANRQEATCEAGEHHKQHPDIRTGAPWGTLLFSR
ncbi:unnamed protein product [Pleuronectes platessa]|uniref:Uncharacterized protein n=1 Tax=Pleuronectes platessa TaxID=8262 RepID=A0A9N7USB8_PLEPL|nr:unnamed protein product [Pleuronectes platessa]